MQVVALALCLVLAAPAAADGWRGGIHLAAGGVVPESSPAGGGGVRVGYQRGRVGFLLELGGFGGFSRDSDSAAGKRVNAAFIGGFTQTVEVDLDARTFASAGFVLGVGTWAHSTQATDADGTVRTESGGVVGDPFLHLLPGLEFHLGWRLGERHHLTMAFGIEVLFAHGHQASATVSADGQMRTATDVRELGLIVWPTFSIGYERK
ncbi:MAG: hypothetical protein ABI175_05200 [Polyangiales bacterium]